MKAGITSSAEVRAYIERAHELRREYILQQLRLGKAALRRLVHGSCRAELTTAGGT